MLFGTIHGSPKKISRIVCGGDRSFSNDSRILDHAFERGVNAFDTARIYGQAEIILGKWLKSRPREQVFVISKGGHPGRFGHRLTRKAIMFDVDSSLRDLGVDYIDAYFFHYDAAKVPIDAVLEIAGELQRSGRVAVVGYSNFDLPRLEQIHAATSGRSTTHLSIASAQLSLPTLNEAMWPGSISICGKQQAPARQWYAEHDVGVFAYSCLGRGFFTEQFWSAIGASAPAEKRPPATLFGSARLRRKYNKLTGKEPSDPAAAQTAWLKNKYDSAANRERYRRAVSMAASKGVTAAQIGLAYVFHKNLNVFAIAGWSSDRRCDENIAALDIKLSSDEVAWLEAE